ncbi:PREDICTED: INO80 complex subunit B-like [Priapulus caudatus]|uniref:INO80 complex subunit B-like n=1 Tax=Priapulus caudatus TaxID=37621 RepID=A0ABM1F1S1_PRICU|nr:PREDICTED: INO80 complex subunit B-like [Priapulus caudatus]XP_014678393.1 PREDICTED: INO80 complex subunit B-like [Priapulus caudatus]XP_014678394.1 PREDICTED: INO80 complex subunit B-like [Priapulus caudatus]XP_014678395.1 PREDICTED: INO80 complex subunit B-like [Priapulus caudatus]
MMDDQSGDDEILNVVEDDAIVGNQKKHKKHKHKKHKKRQEKFDRDEDDDSPELSSPSKPALKLKIKIGGETFGEKSVSIDAVSKDKIKPSKRQEKAEKAKEQPWLISEDKPKGGKKGDASVKVEDSDEEERWLDALEAGDLDDMGELKRDRNTSLMTARQRSLLDRQEDMLRREQEELLIPIDLEPVVVTPEQLEQRKQKSLKRKEMAIEKKEKEKKNTVNRLLYKQDSKRGGRGKASSKTTSLVSYRKTLDGITLSFPAGMEFPLRAQRTTPPPPARVCGVDGCENVRKYSCPRTGMSLCSLQCYKKNLRRHCNSGESVTL